ncbi:MAG TPA: D-glycerate dehydrogenase [Candidatus Saccharimonadales bacterium]|nr:D-glycerate dehydrogenase [Candidatus Saccharimonadales bacterium]
MPRVYITTKIPLLAHDMLAKKDFSVDVNETENPLHEEQLKKILKTYDAVISSVPDKITHEVIAHASPNLKVIANYAVGIDNIDVLAAKRKNIVVTNTPGVAGEAVAEHAFALILACAKKLTEADKYVRAGKYKNWDATLYVSPQIWGKTIGIVGLGKIGTYVGNIAFGGFKMKILYHDIVKSEDFEMLTEAQYCSLEHLLKESDVVTLHVPLVAQTHHLIGKSELAQMKKTAILINTARGAVIDQEALIAALRKKEIAAAGLDVYEHEPDIPEELRTLGNVVLTPHTASATEECREEMARIAAQNVIDVFEGKQPFGLVKVS